jgi:hypothetical protein
MAPHALDADKFSDSNEPKLVVKSKEDAAVSKDSRCEYP